MIGHTYHIAGSLHAEMIGKIENGVLIEFGDHWYTTVAARGFHVLPEGIAIAAGGGERNG